MKKILLVLVALGITTSLCAQEMSSEERKEAMKILEKKREEILERDKIREKEMEEARKLQEDLKAKGGEVTEENAMVAAEDQMTAEEMKNLTPIEKLEVTRKRAMDKLDFYERVVRSVEREENEVKSYEEIMKLD